MKSENRIPSVSSVAKLGAKPAAQGMLMRKCACGSHALGGDECAACRQRAVLRRAGVNRGQISEAPSIVRDVLRSGGRPLDGATRAFFEPRFGHDFSRVRIHADARAAESARAVDALAYTVGSQIVFGKSQFAPHSASGRELLAHELAHVTQQAEVAAAGPSRIGQPGEPAETNADHLAHAALSGQPRTVEAHHVSFATLSRRVIPRLVNCTANTDGAPADPVTDLTAIVDRAEGMATAAALLLTFDAGLTRAGMRPVGSTVDDAFSDRFGEPPAVRGGFLNRLTGSVRPTLEIALSEEMNLMARRYELIAGQFGGGFIHYRCIGGASAFGGCNIPDCSNDAWACPGVSAMFLCPGFWGGDTRTSSTLLIHEASHMIWGSVGHGARGSGGNFRHAECYASFVADIFGVTPGGPACPVP